MGMTAMNLVYVVVFGTVLLMGISAVWAFVWAVKTGQFRNFQKGAVSIFDPDEPQGKVTDHFPDGAKKGDPFEAETGNAAPPSGKGDQGDKYIPTNRIKEHFGEEWSDGDPK